jgi:oxygen-dependent protoporphyrinogen oxidase
MASAPRGLLAGKQGRTTRDYYAGVVGARNYRRVLAPFLSAVPSQNVDDFPAEGPGSLFKRRPRRKDVIKSFTLDGGLSVVADAVMAAGVEVRTSTPARDIARAGAGFSVRTDAGGLTSARLALACAPSVAGVLLGPSFPELARVVGRIASARVETLGVAVRREATELPELAFVVPASDIFWSAVTRDPVPDPAWRGFAFHFRPGHARAERLSRVSQVLGVPESGFADLSERVTALPAPTVGHAGVVAEIDRLLAGSRLSLTGNYFAGLAIEDCVLRSRAEWRRLAALDSVAS